jgi:hypothetical protein
MYRREQIPQKGIVKQHIREYATKRPVSVLFFSFFFVRPQRKPPRRTLSLDRLCATNREARPITTPSELLVVIRGVVDEYVDPASLLMLKVMSNIPIRAQSLALLLRRLATHRSVVAT